MHATSQRCTRCSCPIAEAIPAAALDDYPPIAHDVREEFEQHPAGPYVLVGEDDDMIARPLTPGAIPAARHHRTLYRLDECGARWHPLVLPRGSRRAVVRAAAEELRATAEPLSGAR